LSSDALDHKDKKASPSTSFMDSRAVSDVITFVSQPRYLNAIHESTDDRHIGLIGSPCVEENISCDVSSM